jgi:HSP20 family protein
MPGERHPRAFSESGSSSGRQQRRLAMTFLTKFQNWDPFDDLSLLRNRMERLVPRFEMNPELFTTQWTPPADVVETKNAIVIKTELPGMLEKDIKVEVENGVLTIKGERKIEKDFEEKDYRRVERTYGTFLRTFTLPPTVVPDKISAAYHEGLLEVMIPKKEEAKPRNIHIDVKKKLTAAA